MTLTEVTLDLLTGQHCIDRVDMLFDCGERYDDRHIIHVSMEYFEAKKPSFVLHVHELRTTNFYKEKKKMCTQGTD